MKYASAVDLGDLGYGSFGMALEGRNWSVGGVEQYRYGFQNQETDYEFWGGAISFEYRVEDARLGRFFSVDPLSKKYAYNSPYVFSENRLLDGIEFEGLEWQGKNDKGENVSGESGEAAEYHWVGYETQYKINGTWTSESLIPEDQDVNQYEKRKVAPEGTVGQAKVGNTEYRADGSIMFGNQTKAYKYMYTNANAHDAEEFGMITKNGVLVLPSYLNVQDEAYYKEYGYLLSEGKVYDPVTNRFLPLLATMHTHLGPGDPDPSPYDIKTFTSITPNVPFLTMGNNMKIYAMMGNANGYMSIDLPVLASTIAGLLNGYNLIQLFIDNETNLSK